MRSRAAQMADGVGFTESPQVIQVWMVEAKVGLQRHVRLLLQALGNISIVRIYRITSRRLTPIASNIVVQLGH